jgi:hypothetical protein
VTDCVTGNVFGELSLERNVPRSATVTATSDSLLVQLYAADYTKLVSQAAAGQVWTVRKKFMCHLLSNGHGFPSSCRMWLRRAICSWNSFRLQFQRCALSRFPPSPTWYETIYFACWFCCVRNHHPCFLPLGATSKIGELRAGR